MNSGGPTAGGLRRRRLRRLGRNRQRLRFRTGTGHTAEPTDGTRLPRAWSGQHLLGRRNSRGYPDFALVRNHPRFPEFLDRRRGPRGANLPESEGRRAGRTQRHRREFRATPLALMGPAAMARSIGRLGDCGQALGRLGPRQRGSHPVGRRAGAAGHAIGTLGGLRPRLLCRSFVVGHSQRRRTPHLAGLDGKLGIRRRGPDNHVAWRHDAAAADELRRSPDGPRLVQRPVRELRRLWERSVRAQFCTAAEANTRLASATVHGPCLEIDAEFEVRAETGVSGLEVHRGQGAVTRIECDPSAGRLRLDRRHSGETRFHPAFPGVMEAPLRIQAGRLYLQVWCDTSSSEVFANEGEVVLTALVFPPPGATNWAVFATHHPPQSAAFGSLDSALDLAVRNRTEFDREAQQAAEDPFKGRYSGAYPGRAGIERIAWRHPDGVRRCPLSPAVSAGRTAHLALS
jgi:hypothetical protein